MVELRLLSERARVPSQTWAFEVHTVTLSAGRRAFSNYCLLEHCHFLFIVVNVLIVAKNVPRKNNKIQEDARKGPFKKVTESWVVREVDL